MKLTFLLCVFLDDYICRQDLGDFDWEQLHASWPKLIKVDHSWHLASSNLQFWPALNPPIQVLNTRDPASQSLSGNFFGTILFERFGSLI